MSVLVPPSLKEKWWKQMRETLTAGYGLTTRFGKAREKYFTCETARALFCALSSTLLAGAAGDVDLLTLTDSRCSAAVSRDRLEASGSSSQGLE
jgi:hypothetical protein